MKLEYLPEELNNRSGCDLIFDQFGNFIHFEKGTLFACLTKCG